MALGAERFNVAEQSVEYHIVTLFERLEALRREEGSTGGGATGAAARLPARAELRTLELWRAVSSECVASFLYVFIVCGAAGGAGVGASTSSVLLATALASGFAIATLTLCFAHISGAHVNPAVSAALCVRRLVSPLRAALYVAAQCGGAIAGAAMLYGVTVPGYQGNLAAALSQWGAPAAWERFGVELVLTSVVVVAHFAAADRRWAGSAPLVLGAAYSACSLVSMPYLNPARSLGPSFVLSKWENHWVYWLGPLGGAVVSGLVYEFMSRRRRAPRSRSSAASDEDTYDDLDKPHPQQFRPYNTYRPAASAAPAYCAALPAPGDMERNMERAESLYAGTKSLYCRSPPLTRANLHRSQSVYSKANGAPAPGPLVPAQSLYPMRVNHTLVHNQNAHNQSRLSREPTYGARPGPAGAPQAYRPTCGTRAAPGGAPADPVVEPGGRRPESVYGAVPAPARRGRSVQSDDSSYGSYAGGAGGAGGSAAAPRAPPAFRHAPPAQY